MEGTLRAVFEAEMAAAGLCSADGRPSDAMRHLERAHVLGQHAVLPHTRAHWAMLRVALKRRALADCLGQIARIMLGAIGSALGVVPAGNTGGSNIGMFARLPVEPELAALIEHGRRRRRDGKCRSGFD